VHITQLELKNFRCFSDVTLSFEAPIILIEGVNGSGKTSILEALHYLCYLRSFRTYSPGELVSFEQDNFFLRVQFIAADRNKHRVQVGYSGNKRLVKLDEKSVSTYKELMNFYRVITVTEDDLMWIKGSPDGRRTFIDQALLLDNPDIGAQLKKARLIADQRNAVLKQDHFDPAVCDMFTEQLHEVSAEIQTKRIYLLQHLEERINVLVNQYVDDDLTVHLRYQKKQFYPELLARERRFRRSLFGAHLDDYHIDFQRKKSKSFASRGQQKLIVLLTKIAQLQLLASHEIRPVFLLDDFMTDFDEYRSSALIDALLSLQVQLIFTSPISIGPFEEKLLKLGSQQLKLTD